MGFLEFQRILSRKTERKSYLHVKRNLSHKSCETFCVSRVNCVKPDSMKMNLGLRPEAPSSISPNWHNTHPYIHPDLEQSLWIVDKADPWFWQKLLKNLRQLIGNSQTFFSCHFQQIYIMKKTKNKNMMNDEIENVWIFLEPLLNTELYLHAMSQLSGRSSTPSWRWKLLASQWTAARSRPEWWMITVSQWRGAFVRMFCPCDPILTKQQKMFW